MISGVLAAGQALAESLMVDVCTVRRGGAQTRNPATGRYDTTPGPVIYTGPCKVQNIGAVTATGEVQAGEREVVQYSTELHLPVATSAAVAVDDIAEVTVSQDPALTGRKLRVTQLMYGTHKTARRLPVEDVTG